MSRVSTTRLGALGVMPNRVGNESSRVTNTKVIIVEVEPSALVGIV